MVPSISIIDSRIQQFRRDLDVLTDDIVVQKHITFGDSYILDAGLYFELKSEVSRRFSLHPSQVVLVGSGKLGFSIAPQKRYRHFGDQSDLDLAIVSVELFHLYWVTVFRYSGYWERSARFKEYLFRGWIRPDLLPSHTASEWFEYFRQLTASRKFGYYKIDAGLYRSWEFLESYQQSAVFQCRQVAGTTL